MARLKKDHSGWRSHGLHKKYQQPAINEPVIKHNKKKNTQRWCGGKVGREHDIYRHYHFSRGWDWDKYFRNWIEASCRTCGKKFWRKNDTSLPLEIPIDGEYAEPLPIQVKVDGVPLPIDPQRYIGDWCPFCNLYHPR